MAIQRVHSKWAKTAALLVSELLRQYIPETSPFRRETVRSMLDQYGMIYVKPDRGTFGNGVIRVEKLPSSSLPYQFQLDKKIRQFTTFDAMYKRLLSVQRTRPYLAQKGIKLLQYRNRRFDFRVMVQHNLSNEWETTGIIGRLGLPSKIVTNYHSGATPLPFSTLMSPHMSEHRQTEYLNFLSHLGVETAKQLQLIYPGIKEIGVDFAIDTNLHPWILEVNTLPDPFLFRKLNDRRVFKRIYQYAVGYGRFKARKRKKPA
ncbi:YheC/D-like protein [Paenibacillus cellulosilyticus]|uniref:YheC/D-like protein n=1 Tax=Paenibacillus cellulosilyticus TaxID=375489 RepID=A0A2V2Z1X6_9BACL|nr:YheC/YheD family protein [Paenibacillus cellulosilyticus]PWW08852.1 YheC/D-like protein [Paenibacillus cellulosilyticus]QKS48398.1 YheC/YheD family protein [Paenibacillus cellulosilyticus]